MRFRPARRWSASRRLAALALVLVLAGSAGLVFRQHHEAHVRAAGAALFRGGSALTGALVGHDETLPSMATQCSNCHEAENRPPATAASGAATETAGPATSYAVALDHDALTLPRSRRGGPPSAFDAVTLCTLLRSGVDPVHVIIPTAMPRYTVSDAQCAALWAYLTQR